MINKRIQAIILLGFVLASCVSAFPLSSQSSQANVTVFGIILEDISDTTTKVITDIGQAANCSLGSVSLVDSEDKFYSPRDGDSNFNSGYGECRFFLSYEVPKGTIIKRLRFEPRLPGSVAGTPFSIDWDAIPEVSDGTIVLKMYGVTPGTLRDSWDVQSANSNSWKFDLKLTNNGSENFPISTEDFSIKDQYGWEYDGDYVEDRGNMGQLTPGESMRFDISFGGISRLSRPVILKYHGMALDISAWTG